MVLKAQAQGFKPAFVGLLGWHKGNQQWQAQIRHNGEHHHLHVGCFHDEHEAARFFDAAARRLRPTGEGGRVGSRWLVLNFPPATEEALAGREGMPPKKKQKMPM